jgi:hypothetical protein
MSHRLLSSRFAACCLLLCVLPWCVSAARQDGEPAIAVRFAPDQDPAAELLARIGAARRSIDIVTWSLHDSALAKLLAQKVYDGVKVQLIVDRQPLSWRDVKSSVPALYDAGVAVRTFGLDQGAGANGKLRGCNFVLIDRGTDHACVLVVGPALVRGELDDAPGTLLTLTGPAELLQSFADRFDELLRRSGRWLPARETAARGTAARGTAGKTKPKATKGF